MDFYVGADKNWLTRSPYPLMVSHGRLREAKRLPRATVPSWVCDSRGFTELQQNGKWTFTPRVYVGWLRRYHHEIGRMQWASPMDWMCEPAVIHGGRWGRLWFAGTGLSEREHQIRTVENYGEIQSLLNQPDDPMVIPSLQGWADYGKCVEMYESAGVDLRTFPVVGLGSTCRREGTKEVLQLIQELSAYGIRLHGYGAKTQGLAMYGHLLASADSFAWSYGARLRGGRCQHGKGIKWETNCPEWAGAWRENVLAGIGRAQRSAGHHRGPAGGRHSPRVGAVLDHEDRRPHRCGVDSV